MLAVKRGIGRLVPKTADSSEVATLIKDFDNADKMLAKIVDDSKAWRDAWIAILTTQSNLANEFDILYKPIVGAGESSGPSPAQTPQINIDRTDSLKEAYLEVKADLLEEVNKIDTLMIRPSMNARDSLQPMKKTIKRREEKKLDFERAQNRFEGYRKKTGRSDRDLANMAKAEDELNRATETYNVADDQLKSALPPLIAAIFSMLPVLLASQVMTQNTLLAQVYTVLHNYCQDHGYQSPPPSMDQVVSTWEAAFKPLQAEAEGGLKTLANGKAVHQPMELNQHQGSSITGLNIRNGFAQRRASNQSTSSRPPVSPSLSASRADSPPPPLPGARPKFGRSLSPSHSASYGESAGPPLPGPRPKMRPLSPSPSASYNESPAPPLPGPRPTIGSHSSASSSAIFSGATSPKPGLASPSGSDYYTPSLGSTHSSTPRNDYFNRGRIPSSSATSPMPVKKKPPPPPPKKKPALRYVVALYDYTGQSQNDLSFQEGDRIRVIKETTDAGWFEGELRGVTGTYPGNYCQPA